MDLYLIRHAQSTNNVLENILDRHYDPDLTELGYRQADRLADYLANEQHPYRFTTLYCSPMRRAMLTTRPVAAALGLTPQVWTDVFEYGGIYLQDKDNNKTGYPGLTRAAMQAEFPNFVLPDTVTEKGWWDAALAKETKPACADRARRVVQTIEEWVQQDDDAQVAIVSHAGFIDRIIRGLLGHSFPTDDTYIYRYFTDNTSITHLGLSSDPEWPTAMRFMSRVDHLPSEMRWNGRLTATSVPKTEEQ